MRALLLAPLGLALLATACGETTGERATTGAAGGAATGAVVGGPVGAVVGGGIGAAGGAYRPEADQYVGEKTEAVKEKATSTTNTSAAMDSSGTSGKSGTRARGAAASSGGASKAQVRQAQSELQKQGLYHGKIDGLYGPQTSAAVRDYQAKENLSQTGKLDRTTMQHLRNGVASSSGSTGSNPPAGSSGSSGTNPVPSSGTNEPANTGSSSGTEAGTPGENR